MVKMMEKGDFETTSDDFADINIHNNNNDKYVYSVVCISLLLGVILFV